MVKVIMKEDSVKVPAEVTVSVKSKVVTVTGPKGKLTRSFSHVPIQIKEVVDQSKKVVAVSLRIWFAKSKSKSCVTSICHHINNMILGVTKGFKYTMKYGYNIKPMQPIAVEGGKVLQILNYLGDKYTRKIACVGDTRVAHKEGDPKKEIVITGIDKEAVGLTGAMIHQSCRPKGRDKRIFKDGIYFFQRELNE